MKKTIALVLAILVAVTFLCSCGKQENEFIHRPDFAVNGQSVCLLSLDTGTTIFQKNDTNIVYSSSFTQAVAGLVVLERCTNLDGTVVVPDLILDHYDEASGIPLAHIHSGEEYTYRDLLAMYLLEGDYDAIDVLAYTIAGSIDNFIDLMNAETKSLGASSTRFLNCTGAYDDSQYTTAKDIATVVKTCIGKTDYTNLSSAPQYTVQENETHGEITLVNSNPIVHKGTGNQYYFGDAVPLFSGFSKQAGDCVASYASSNGMQMVLVVMNAPVPDSNFSESAASSEFSSDSDDISEEGDSEGESSEPDTPDAEILPSDKITNTYSLSRPALLDTANIYNWAFSTTKVITQAENLELLADIPVVGEFDHESVQVMLNKKLSKYLPKNVSAENAVLLLRLPTSVNEAIEKGTQIGTADIIVNNELITDNVPLIASHSLSENKTQSGAFLKIILWIFIVILSLAVLLFIIRTINIARYKKRKQKRLAAQRKAAREKREDLYR